VEISENRMHEIAFVSDTQIIHTSYGRRLITSHISCPTAGFAGINCKEGSRHDPNASSILNLASFKCSLGTILTPATPLEVPSPLLTSSTAER